jgi:putative ABC transport system substrate-binding protein
MIAGGASLAWSRAARGQQRASMPVIGYFGAGSPGPFATRIAAFRDGLRSWFR